MDRADTAAASAGGVQYRFRFEHRHRINYTLHPSNRRNNALVIFIFFQDVLRQGRLSPADLPPYRRYPSAMQVVCARPVLCRNTYKNRRGCGGSSCGLSSIAARSHRHGKKSIPVSPSTQAIGVFLHPFCIMYCRNASRSAMPPGGRKIPYRPRETIISSSPLSRRNSSPIFTAFSRVTP